jgi:CubicO group peptidase (beta-lactamase class C family)
MILARAFGFNPLSRCRVPDSLEAVTDLSAAEVDPRRVGVQRAAVEDIWKAVENLYRSGMHPAVQLCIRRRGEVVLDRAIGHASGNGPDDPPEARKTRATIATPINIFSASKAVTAMVIHLLDQKRLLHVDDPVSEYIPEFASHGKDRITIEHVLTHRAGIPNVPPEEMRLETLMEPERILELLYDAEPTWFPGRRLAYHAITGGFILGEIVRRVTGKNIRQVLREEILQPLGFRWMSYGVRPSDVPKVARNYATGPPPLPPISWMIRRAIGIDVRTATELSNDPRFLTQILPSANVITTANELSRFYQLLLNEGELDGVRIFEPRTIHRATSEQSYLEFDLTLGIPLRYSMGFMLAGIGLYGPDTPHAFGHVGLSNIFSWADPERRLAVALLNTGKPTLYPEVYYIYDLMRRISLAFPREPADSLRRRRPSERQSPAAHGGKTKKRLPAGAVATPIGSGSPLPRTGASSRATPRTATGQGQRAAVRTRWRREVHRGPRRRTASRGEYGES